MIIAKSHHDHSPRIPIAVWFGILLLAISSHARADGAPRQAPEQPSRRAVNSSDAKVPAANHAILSADSAPINAARYQLLAGESAGPRAFGDLYDVAAFWVCGLEQDYLTDTGGGPGPCLQQTFDGVTEYCGTNVFNIVANVNVVEFELVDPDTGNTLVIVQVASDDGSDLLPPGNTCMGGDAIDTIGCDLAKQDAGGPGIPGDPLDPDVGVSPFEILSAEAVIFGAGGQTLLTFTLNSAGTTRTVLKDRFTVGGADNVVVTAMQFRYLIDVPKGACCEPDGICVESVSNLECSLLGGQYFGDLSLCSDFNCIPQLVCGTVPGDVNGDGIINGLDVQPFVDCIVGGGPGCDCADMTFDNHVNEDDTQSFIAALMNLPTQFWTTIGPLPATITTDAGDQPATVEGELRFSAGPPNAQGVRAVTLNELILGTSSVPTLASETGGMSFLMRPGTGSGTWDMTTGQFDFSADIDAGYWLIGEKTIEPPLAGPTEDVEEKQREFWGAFLTATAALGQGVQSVELDGELTIDVINSITNSVTKLTVPLPNLSVPRKVFNVPNCPQEKKCNKRIICLQPVFVRDDNGMNPTGSSLATFQAAADALWARCCVEFDWKAPVFVNETDFKIIEKSDLAAGRLERNNLRGQVDEKGTNDCIEIFFVDKFVNDNGDEHASGDGVTASSGLKSAKVIVADAAIDDCNPDVTRVLAHELGHVMNIDHPTGCVMTPGGAAPNCPANNPDKVKLSQCKSLRNPLLKEKNPKEDCCKDPNC